ncbi:MAG: DUF4194 domain-containing protein [Opitutaceae bacterium]|jgi:hypothetical protein|nr:DUF4194 domain-containing protein [Opitutaceae bacterium]
MKPPWPIFWDAIPEADRDSLSDVLCELLSSGAILGGSGRNQERYQTTRIYQAQIAEYFAPLNLELFEEQDSPVFILRPASGECALLAHFTKDETLLLLALWRMNYDVRMSQITRVVVVSVKEIFGKLRIYFKNIEPPAPTALEGMLAKLRSRRLVSLRNSESGTFDDETQVEILPTLPRVIPFDDLAAWDTRCELAAPAPNEGDATAADTTAADTATDVATDANAETASPSPEFEPEDKPATPARTTPARTTPAIP